MKIIKKAYKVWVNSHIGEYPVFSKHDVEPVYAKNSSEAKSKCDMWDAKNEDGDEARWIDIHCIRDKESDKVEHNGYEMYRYQYLRELIKEKRNNSLLKLKDNEMFYVQDSRQYVGNSVLWHALNGNGYTTDIKKAHKYTKQEIIKQFSNCRDSDVIWSAKHIDDNVSHHVDVQNLDFKHKK